jgi:hypothetical protein
MSIDYGIYVGPYARCIVRRVEAQRLHLTCPNAGCSKYGSTLRTEFCDRCGARTESLPEFYTADAVDAWDVRERIDDRLRTPGGDGYMAWSREQGAHLWTPNIGMPGRDMHLDSRVDFALIDITPEQARDELTRFAAFFASELALFRELYGPNAVSGHWGIIQEYT